MNKEYKYLGRIESSHVMPFGCIRISTITNLHTLILYSPKNEELFEAHCPSNSFIGGVFLW